MKTKSLENIWIVIVVAVIIMVTALAYFFWVNNFIPIENQMIDSVTTTPSPDPSSTPKPTATTDSTVVVAVSPVSPISPISPVILDPVSPEEIQLQINQAILAQDQQDYARSIGIINGLLNKDPRNTIALNIRGSAYFAVGNYSKALADYAQSIKLDPLFPHPYFNRGRVYRTLGEYEKAIEDLQKSIDLAPLDFNYRANGNIGLIYYEQGKYEEALEAFNQSIAANLEDKADVYFFRGETYTAMENYDAAINDYQAAIDRFSQYDKAYQSLGYALYKTEQFEPAADALDQALSFSPDNSATHTYLALVNVALDKPDDAQTQISRAIDLSGNLSDEEKDIIFSRISTELEAFAEDNPNAAGDVEQLLNLLSGQ